MDIATRVTPDTYGTRIDIKPQYDNFIDGRWQKPADGEYSTTSPRSPASC